MSGILLLFAAGVGYYPNALLGTFAQSYNLVHFTDNVLMTYGFSLAIAVVYTLYISMRQRRDSTEHYFPLAVTVFFMASLVGFASPFLWIFLEQELLEFGQVIARLLN